MASSQLLTIPDHELFNASELDDLEAHVQKQVREVPCEPSAPASTARSISLSWMGGLLTHE